MAVWINGTLVPDDGARISIFDHGLVTGDGVFETIKVVSGERAGDKTAGPNRYDGPAPGQAPATQAPAGPTRTITIIDGSTGNRFTREVGHACVAFVGS